MDKDNPGYRLHKLLMAGKAINKQTNCREAWYTLLEISDDVSLMTRLSKVMALPQQIIDGLSENYPDSANTWRYWQGQVVAGFAAQNFSAAWSTFIDHIDPHTLTYLQLSTDMLDRVSRAKVIGSEDLAKVRESLSFIYEELRTSEIDDELKKYLFRSIRKLIAAIDEYKIVGGEALLDALSSTVGHAYFDRGYSKFLTNDKIGMHLFEVIAAMSNLVTVAVGLPVIAHSVEALKLLTN